MNYNPNDGGDYRRTAERRRPHDKDTGELTVDSIIYAGAISLTFFFLEMVFRFASGAEVSGSFFVYITLFSIAAGALLSVLSTFFSEKVNHIITSVVLSFISLYFCVQLVYSKFFLDYFYWDQMLVAGDVTAFWREALSCIIENIIWLLLMLAPAVLYAIFGKKFLPAVKTTWTFKGIGALLAVVVFVSGVGFVNAHDDSFGDAYYYNEGFIMAEAASRFGIMTALRLDTQYTLFGRPTLPDEGTDEPPVTVPDGGWDNLFDDTTAPPVVDPPVSGEDTSGGTSQGDTTAPPAPPPPVDISPNVMNIDFDKLISSSKGDLKAAHEWFSKREPTNKNAYTGMFEGKNLIFITVEGWAPAAINQKLTPTLYKMKNEGFVFENYYCSNWGGSTATGEYALLTGNFYASSSCLRKSSSNYMPYTLGNVMSSIGYKSSGFHNHTYSYYSRDVSHPNFGYDWHGVGNWDVEFTSAWPKSDRELALNTLSYITADKPFHLYYMTVSGHAYHTGNKQANKHKSYVKSLDLGYTTNGAICYVASQYEVELMVAELCAELERRGELEDTVFVMAPDHYPYSIVGKTNDKNQAVDDDEGTMAALAELYGLPVENIFLNFDLYRAPLIIWSASMKAPVKVDKVCSAIDVLPTVLNLFGAEYDSRLIMGRDILSDSDGFVILNCSNSSGISSSNNWITKYGIYNASTKTFLPRAGYTQEQINTLVSMGYVDAHNDLLKKMRTYSNYILEKDYYRKVFEN